MCQIGLGWGATANAEPPYQDRAASDSPVQAAESGEVTLSTQPDQSDIDRGAAVLLYLLTWRGGFGNDEAVRSLQEGKLGAAIVMTDLGRRYVH